MSKPKILLVALGIVTVAVTLLYTLAPSPSAVAPRPEEVTGLVLRGYDDGAVAWETEAARGEMVSANGRLEDVVLRLLGGTTTVEVRAAEVQQESESVTMTGGVRAETNDGLLVSSDEMTWREKARVLDAGLTALTLRGDQIAADVFSYDARSETASLVGVRATLSRAAALAATSDKGEISRDTVRLLDNVRVFSTDAVTQGEAEPRPTFEVTADSLTVSRDTVTASGNVSADVYLAPQGDDREA